MQVFKNKEMREETTIGMSFELDKELNETAALLLLECFRLLYFFFFFLVYSWFVRNEEERMHRLDNDDDYGQEMMILNLCLSIIV